MSCDVNEMSWEGFAQNYPGCQRFLLTTRKVNEIIQFPFSVKIAIHSEREK